MFIFRGLTTLISIIGFILGGMITYVGFFPLTAAQKPRLELTKIVGCSKVDTFSFKSANITDADVKQIKSAIGESTPIELIKSFANSLGSLTNGFGSTTALNIEYCTASDSNDVLINKFNSNLDSQKKYFQYGSFGDFIDQINSLPYAHVTDVDIKIPTRFARSNYCNTPVQNMDVYLYSVVDTDVNVNGNSSIKKAVIFNISLENNEQNTTEYKFIRNVVASGQYIKSKLYCNE